jgi:hypothetical protein
MYAGCIHILLYICFLDSLQETEIKRARPVLCKVFSEFNLFVMSLILGYLISIFYVYFVAVS